MPKKLRQTGVNCAQLSISVYRTTHNRKVIDTLLGKPALQMVQSNATETFDAFQKSFQALKNKHKKDKCAINEIMGHSPQRWAFEKQSDR